MSKEGAPVKLRCQSKQKRACFPFSGSLKFPSRVELNRFRRRDDLHPRRVSAAPAGGERAAYSVTQEMSKSVGRLNEKREVVSTSRVKLRPARRYSAEQRKANTSSSSQGKTTLTNCSGEH